MPVHTVLTLSWSVSVRHFNPCFCTLVLECPGQACQVVPLHIERIPVISHHQPLKTKRSKGFDRFVIVISASQIMCACRTATHKCSVLLSYHLLLQEIHNATKAPLSSCITVDLAMIPALL